MVSKVVLLALVVAVAVTPTYSSYDVIQATLARVTWWKNWDKFTEGLSPSEKEEKYQQYCEWFEEQKLEKERLRKLEEEKKKKEQEQMMKFWRKNVHFHRNWTWMYKK